MLKASGHKRFNSFKRGRLKLLNPSVETLGLVNYIHANGQSPGHCPHLTGQQFKRPRLNYSTTNSLFKTKSSDDLPIITLNLPGSTVQFMFLSSIAKSSGCKVKCTVFFSPGARFTRVK